MWFSVPKSQTQTDHVKPYRLEIVNIVFKCGMEMGPTLMTTFVKMMTF